MTQETRVPNPDVPERLFDEFPPTSAEEWRAAAEKTLKGAPFEKRLLTRTYEGITLQPIYAIADTASLPHTASLPGLPSYVRGTRALGYRLHPWEVAQELPYPTAAEVNQAAREDLPRGLTTLHVRLDRATLLGQDPDQAPPELVGQGGTSLASRDDLATLFAEIPLAQTPLLFAAGANALPLAALILAAAEAQGLKLSKVQGCIGADPLGALAGAGTLPCALERCYDAMAWLTAWAATSAPELRTIQVEVHPYHNGGANAVQDLAFALATGAEYLRAMQARGLEVDTVAPRMQFAFSLGSPFFIEIARLRAARMLWARVVAAFGGNARAQKLRLHGRTSAWTKTRADAYNNLLRATTEAFAGVMGGCDSLHVSPFDEAIGLPDEFSRRIARNVQIILQQECNFYRLVDPAGGSAAVETLTDEIAREAWTLFQRIEEQGGMAAALAAGFPQARVASVRAERMNQIALRREVIVGANMYVNPRERSFTPRTVDHIALHATRAAELQRLRAAVGVQAALEALARAVATAPDQVLPAAIAAARAGATLGALGAAIGAGSAAGISVEPIPAHRGAEQFEALQAAAAQFAARTGSRPKVFLATMGPVSQHKARADFSTGFFEAGGFEVVAGPGFQNVEEAARAAHASGASIVVICSTDETYPELVPPLVRLLKDGHPDMTVVLAGYPADQVEAHRVAGVDEFIHLRADCYATLARLQQLKGVAL
ncbi:MAG: methylmalonyl-CoA mutase family protein [Chloroflexaceae bacterium]